MLKKAARSRWAMSPSSSKTETPMTNHLTRFDAAAVDPATGIILDEVQSKRLVSEFGLRVPEGVFVPPEQPDLSQIEHLAMPLVAKVVSPDVIHKSDGGFVACNLNSIAGVDAALDRMRGCARMIDADVEGFLIEEMMAPGVELVVGGVTDQSFGPMIMLGLGGVYVELFKDVSFRICPIERLDAAGMIDDLVCRPILEGARGGVMVDREALIQLLLRVGGENGALNSGNCWIEEMDLNPIVANLDGLIVVDARIRMKDRHLRV